MHVQRSSFVFVGLSRPCICQPALHSKNQPSPVITIQQVASFRVNPYLPGATGELLSNIHILSIVQYHPGNAGNASAGHIMEKLTENYSSCGLSPANTFRVKIVRLACCFQPFALLQRSKHYYLDLTLKDAFFLKQLHTPR